MPKEPNYYQILGLQPDADTEAIGAAYRGRTLKFRVKQTNERGAEQVGPTQEEIEQAFAILGNHESRALYDAVYFPTKPTAAKRRRRIPIWLWAIVGVWLVALLAAVLVGLRSRAGGDGGAIGRIAGPTATIVAAGGTGSTVDAPPPGGGASAGSPTLAAALPQATATSPVPGAAATITVTATAMATAAPIPPTMVPDPTRASASTTTVGPTNTAPMPQPTVTVTPSPTSVPPTIVPPTEEPPTAMPPIVVPEPEPEPAPAATPSFRATDRIGTSLSVNLRSGPGPAYPSLGLLPTGTQLQATGEMARAGGQLWRRFLLQDGRVGWVRDLDVFSAR